MCEPRVEQALKARKEHALTARVEQAFTARVEQAFRPAFRRVLILWASAPEERSLSG
jgi:hypothetical protein